MREIYLHDIPLDEARRRFQRALADAELSGLLGVDEIPVDEHAVGRVLAEPLWAKISSPHYHASAMDGFAVRARDTEGAMATRPRNLLYGSQAVYVDTGDPLPDWANAVIPIEVCEPLTLAEQAAANLRQPEIVRIREATTPWRNVRPMGEDLVATELVLPSGHVLRPVDLGAAAASGQSILRVAKKPRVAVLPTGSELISIGERAAAGEIIEFNSVVLAAQLLVWGALPKRYPIIEDNPEKIRQVVQRAVEESDLVLINAGSSAGSEDFSAEIIGELGEVLVHGVAVRPGHPVILGMVRRSNGSKAPAIGVPGYPVSAALTGEIFIEPLIATWLGRRQAEPQQIQAQLTRKLTSPAGDDDYVRMVVGKVGEKILAAPLTRGAGVISSMVRADGITIVPRGTQGYPAGEQVTVNLYRGLQDLDRTILAIGSHDIILDLLAQHLAHHGRRFVSANAGSQAGLIALRRGEAHLAGSHLLDPESGEYNVRFIHQYLPGIPVRLVALAGRAQGLIVSQGNPLKLSSLADLQREEVRFVNRQRGAGTRVLLDYHLDRLGIVPAQVTGYDQEEYTHLAVAAAVSSGRADCGLGIAAAARALELDFLPLYEERYDLVIPLVYADSALLQPLIALLEDRKFRGDVARLPGYDIAWMGKIIAELE
jgi:putative molybdopterin biosynthesis protein